MVNYLVVLIVLTDNLLGPVGVFNTIHIMTVEIKVIKQYKIRVFHHPLIAEPIIWVGFN